MLLRIGVRNGRLGRIPQDLSCGLVGQVYKKVGVDRILHVSIGVRNGRLGRIPQDLSCGLVGQVYKKVGVDNFDDSKEPISKLGWVRRFLERKYSRPVCICYTPSRKSRMDYQPMSIFRKCAKETLSRPFVKISPS